MKERNRSICRLHFLSKGVLSFSCEKSVQGTFRQTSTHCLSISAKNSFSSFFPTFGSFIRNSLLPKITACQADCTRCPREPLSFTSPRTAASCHLRMWAQKWTWGDRQWPRSSNPAWVFCGSGHSGSIFNCCKRLIRDTKRQQQARTCETPSTADLFALTVVGHPKPISLWYAHTSLWRFLLLNFARTFGKVTEDLKDWQGSTA